MPSDLSTICEERLRLLREYSDAVSSYSTSVREMADFVTSGEEVRANQARRTCRTAWDEAERSRLALYRHEADHNCTRSVNARNISGT
jgi:cob(I)alamin adenosyltransferase